MTLIRGQRRGRFAVLPILGIALLGLAVAIRPAVAAHARGVGEALLAGVTVVYLAIAMMLGRLTWRSPALLGVMLVAHAMTALVFGLALSLGDNAHHDLLAAWQLGLWDFAPSPLLIAAFAVACAALSWPLLAPRDPAPAAQATEASPPERAAD